MASVPIRLGKENRYIHLLIILLVFFLFFPFVRNIKAEFALIATFFSIIGQLYLAIFISRLVGLHVMHNAHDKKQEV